MALTERLNILIDASGSKAVAEFNKVGRSATTEMGKAEKSSGLLANGLQNIGAQAKAGLVAGLAVGGAAIAKFALDGITKFAAYAGEVRNFQRTSGATAEVSSRFVAVLDDLAISSETGAAAISKLTRNAAAGKLEAFNVELARTKQGSLDTTETLMNVADAYSATADPAERARLRFAAFGKQGDALIPILEKGRSGLKAFFDGVSDAQLLSQDELDKAERYRLAMDRLGDSVSDVQREFGLAASGPAAALADVISELVENGSQFGKQSSGWFGGFIGDLKNTAEVVFRASTGMLEAGESSKSMAGKQREAAAAARELTQDLDAEAEALDDVANATLASFDAGIRYARGINSLEDAQADYNAKEKEWLDLSRQRGPASAAAVAAGEAMERAELDLRDAVLQVSAASASNAEQQAKMNGQTFNMARDAIPAQIAELSRLRDTLAPGSPLLGFINGYIEQLKKIPASIQTTVTVKASAPAAFNVALHQREQRGSSGAYDINNANGNILTFAGGSENHVAQIAKAGAMRLWAEPETGGEAYIPLAPSKRARSRAILSDVADRFGMTAFGNGGFAGRGWTASTGGLGGSTMQVTIIMPPGSNGEDVVNKIKRYERNNTASWRK